MRRRMGVAREESKRGGTGGGAGEKEGPSHGGLVAVQMVGESPGAFGFGLERCRPQRGVRGRENPIVRPT